MLKSKLGRVNVSLKTQKSKEQMYSTKSESGNFAINPLTFQIMNEKEDFKLSVVELFWLFSLCVSVSSVCLLCVLASR
jgi:hypothetical protein